MWSHNLSAVMPAKAGIQYSVPVHPCACLEAGDYWVPAFAGTTPNMRLRCKPQPL